MIDSVNCSLVMNPNKAAFQYDNDFIDCIHELGHVVAARAHGFPVAWVSYDADFLRTDPLAIENGVACGAPAAMVLASPTLGPIMERRKISGIDEERVVRGYCIEALAEPFAEFRKNPTSWHLFAPRDLRQAKDVIEHLILKRKKIDKIFSEVVKAADEFVQANFSDIERLARALLFNRTLLAPQIDSILGLNT